MTANEYQNQGVSIQELEDEITEILKKLRADGTLVKYARAHGVDESKLAEAKNPTLISIKPKSAGYDFGPIVLVLAPFAISMMTDVWKEIILPKLRRKFNADSIVETPRKDD